MLPTMGAMRPAMGSSLGLQRNAEMPSPSGSVMAPGAKPMQGFQRIFRGMTPGTALGNQMKPILTQAPVRMPMATGNVY